MKIHGLAFALLLAAVAVSNPVFGQTPSAGVTGRVTDAVGAVVPGAVIRVTNLDTNISRQTVA
ncbi:MAG: carboxypeptidase-like regulatory domain-containing protein, partial [Acidobacteriota bacterium]